MRVKAAARAVVAVAGAAVALCGCADIFDITTVPAPSAPDVDPCAPDAVVPASIMLSGQLLDATNNAPLTMLSVDATPGGVAPTDAEGRFAIDVATNTRPTKISLTATGQPGFPPHAIHYQRPFTTTPSDASSKLLPQTAVDGLYTMPRMEDRATALLSVRDCAMQGVANAMIETTPATEVLYQGGGAATNGTGVAYAINIPPGPLAIGDALTVEVRENEMLIVYLLRR